MAHKKSQCISKLKFKWEHYLHKLTLVFVPVHLPLKL
jgi:hypothetical protein